MRVLFFNVRKELFANNSLCSFFFLKKKKGKCTILLSFRKAKYSFDLCLLEDTRFWKGRGRIDHTVISSPFAHFFQMYRTNASTNYSNNCFYYYTDMLKFSCTDDFSDLSIIDKDWSNSSFSSTNQVNPDPSSSSFFSTDQINPDPSRSTEFPESTVGLNKVQNSLLRSKRALLASKAQAVLQGWNNNKTINSKAEAARRRPRNAKRGKNRHQRKERSRHSRK